MYNFLYNCDFYENKLSYIQNTTRQSIFNTLIGKYMNKNKNSKILILLYYYFKLCIGSKCDITDDSYIIHKHELTLLDGLQKDIFEYITLNVN